ncbi:MAG: LptF/LptG family permease [Bacteroidetes bacterium]|nr:LptF/LptG family permease [Bacteroidota bacterium]
MFKKLDLLIVKAFIGPFVATFFITLFVLVLQFFWLYIDDVVGKGIDPLTVGQLVFYLSATLVPLALPLAVLLSSIMTLGNLGETFELVAIKSAGISLLRFLRPLFFVSILLCIIAFFFNNNLLPIANLKMNTIKYDIIMTKPAFDIKEGVFYDRIEGFVIKIGKKEKDDSTIRNVVIYEQSNGTQQDNMIIADEGTMVVTPDKQSLVFTLRNGSRYQEDAGRSGVSNGTQLVRMSFKQYKKVMDLSSFKMSKTDDSSFRNNFQMKTIFQLGKSIDSVKNVVKDFSKKAGQTVAYNVKVRSYLDTSGWDKVEKGPAPTYLKSEAVAKDSVRKLWAVAVKKEDSTQHAKDSLDKVAAQLAKTGKKPATPAAGAPALPAPAAADAATKPKLSKTPPDPVFADLLPDSVYSTVLERTNSTVNSTKISLDQPAVLYSNESGNVRQQESAWHEKITLAVAVIVMFLIGAPLGSIIRKGGIGLPLVFAVIFFVVFFLLNNFGKKFVSQAVLTPIAGMWMATYVLTPIGLFLTYKALNDSQLFNKEFYFRLTKNIRTFADRVRKWRETRKISVSKNG